MILDSRIDENKWYKILQYFSKKDIFFDPNFHNIHKNCFQNVAFFYEENQNYFFLPIQLFKIKSYENLYDFESINGYSGPISNCISKQFIQNAWKNFFIELKQKSIVAGILRFHPILCNHRYAENNKEINLEKLRKTVCLKIDKHLNLQDIYSLKTQKKLLKAKKNGIKILKLSSLKDIQLFSKLYFATMKKKQANLAYFFHKDYFKLMYKYFKKNILIYLAYKNNKLCGGLIGFKYGSFVHVHLSANDHIGLKYGSAYLLREKIISDNFFNGTIIHFGGGLTNDSQDSLLRFKMNFSNQSIDYYIGKIVIDNSIYSKLIKDWDIKNPNNKVHNSFFLRYKY